MKYIYSFIVVVLFQMSFAQEQAMFYFDNNKFELNNTETAKLQKWILENKTSKILSITGSTDEVGSSGYNDTLSLKRVSYIFNQIQGKVNIRADFKSISLGEKGATSIDKAENRKVIIQYLIERDLAKENKILGIKEEILLETIDTTKVVSIENQFKNAKVGDKIIINTINFFITTDQIIPDSKFALEQLLDLLRNYYVLKIEIQGHICCNPLPKDKKSLRLSEKRAKKIHDFLVENGIDKNRLKYKGFGSSKPIYIIPESNNEQERLNRRVEILILEN
ncbi:MULTISPECIES: OmpA family protein [unclassified Flavobacterium]|uniref:OmpA family protein n=1 Tax=unclassified Flavobacterium TaxID=196869 RepID=UPI0012919B0F|nr:MULTISPECIES: OmpA family protein [unclassified Flavobacterium]MQP52502.1 OmpA family protein [Flavobacterium sp. LMO9]MQP62572.1 OmpA family protein [Flavobacterium sp. LMO6]